MSDPTRVISLALLKHANIDPDRVRAVRYEHRIGEMPTLIVEYFAYGNDPVDIAETVAYQWYAVGATEDPL